MSSELKDPPASPKSFKWSSDKVVSMSAIFISLMTLITFVHQNRLLQKQAALSVLPYLSITTAYTVSSKPSFRLKIINRGVGPAIIESQEVSYDGKVYKDDFIEFLNEQIPGFDSLQNIAQSNLVFGSVLPSGEDLDIIGVYSDINEVNLIAAKLQELNDSGMKYKVVYRSIYGERWMITESSDLPIVLPKL